jgi:hypothetical protein
MINGNTEISDTDRDSRGKATYANMLHTALTCRRFFRTRKSWPGLGPGRMREGDVVVVFHGESSHYVLRPVKGRDDHYYLLGECYVDILMNEGAYGMLKKGGVEERVFHLV